MWKKIGKYVLTFLAGLISAILGTLAVIRKIGSTAPNSSTIPKPEKPDLPNTEDEKERIKDEIANDSLSNLIDKFNRRNSRRRQ